MTIQRSSHVASVLLLQQRGIKIGSILELGAAEGGFLSYRQTLGLYPEAPVLLVDCMAENEPLYQILCRRYACDYEIAAITNVDGEVEIALDPQTYNTHVTTLQDRPEYGRRRVKAMTLDRLVAEHKPEPPYYIRLDLQGGELDALRGGLATLKDTAIITAELQLYLDHGSFSEFLPFIERQGFVLYDLGDLGYAPNGGDLYQLYATFLRRDLDDRATREWATPEQWSRVNQSLRQRRSQLEDLVRKMDVAAAD